MLCPPGLPGTRARRPPREGATSGPPLSGKCPVVRFGGEWPRDRFRAHGITYRVADQSKSEIYGAFLPLLTGGRVELLDHSGLVAEFLALDRRVARGGASPSIPPSGARLRRSTRSRTS
jgi:hypothetical protein